RVPGGPAEDAHRDRAPPDDGLGRDDDAVEQPVVDPGGRYQLDPALQRAAVAEDDRAGAGRRPALAVDREPDAEALDEELAGTGDEVGDPPDLRLEVLARAAHDLGVEAHARHDEEGVTVHRRSLHRPFGLPR